MQICRKIYLHFPLGFIRNNWTEYRDGTSMRILDKVDEYVDLI